MDIYTPVYSFPSAPRSTVGAVDRIVRVPMLLFSAVVDAIDAQTEAAMYAWLASCIFNLHNMRKRLQR